MTVRGLLEVYHGLIEGNGAYFACEALACSLLVLDPFLVPS